MSFCSVFRLILSRTQQVKKHLYRGKSGLSLCLVIHLRLVYRMRMHGFIFLLPHKPSQSGQTSSHHMRKLNDKRTLTQFCFLFPLNLFHPLLFRLLLVIFSLAYFKMFIFTSLQFGVNILLGGKLLPQCLKNNCMLNWADKLGVCETGG